MSGWVDIDNCSILAITSFCQLPGSVLSTSLPFLGERGAYRAIAFGLWLLKECSWEG